MSHSVRFRLWCQQVLTPLINVMKTVKIQDLLWWHVCHPFARWMTYDATGSSAHVDVPDQVYATNPKRHLRCDDLAKMPFATFVTTSVQPPAQNELLRTSLQTSKYDYNSEYRKLRMGVYTTTGTILCFFSNLDIFLFSTTVHQYLLL